MKTIKKGNQFKIRMEGLVKRLASEGWTKDIEQSMMRAVDDILDGRAIPARLSSDIMRRERMIDMPKWFLAVYHLACGADDSANGRWDSPVANRIVEMVLKGLGKWTENIYGKCQRSYGKPFGEGSESYVFKGGKCKVVKASNLSHTGNVVFAMERLMLSNLFFPDTAHHVLGMGSMHGDTKNRPNGHVAFCLEQNMLKFNYFKTEKEAERAMSRRGFHKALGDEYCDKFHEVRLIDCKRINIPHDDLGNILFIDPAVTLNYGTVGKLEKLQFMGDGRTVRQEDGRPEGWDERIGSVWNSPLYTRKLDDRVKARAKESEMMTWIELRNQALACL